MFDLVSDGNELFVEMPEGDRERVIRGWESFTGWYWFAFELDRTQTSRFPDGRIVEDDKIFFGLVQGTETEIGYFSQAELEMNPKIWEIPTEKLYISGRRGETR